MREDLDTIAAFRAADKRADEAAGYSKAAEAQEDLDDAELVALDVLAAMPAPHGAALIWKIEYLFGKLTCDDEGSIPSYSTSYVRPFFDDVRRLAGEAVQ